MNFALMGLETEYGLTVLDQVSGVPWDNEDGATTLFYEAVAQFPNLPSDDHQGVFLGNGGRLYIDVGGHLEYASPECSNPADLVRYTLAGDRIMEKLVAQLEQRPSIQALAFRGNVSYGRPQTWACHESFLCHKYAGRYARDLAPFLASRVVFAGSGGFNPFSQGIDFTLSPRSHFISTLTNDNTMNNRPLINLRDEGLSSGFHRLHLICADGLGSEKAAWLRAGTTALVISMLDAGFVLPGSLALADPVKALRSFASDTTLTAKAGTEDGSEATAVQIQRAYLREAVTSYSADKSAFPDWVQPVLNAWRKVLRALESAPERLDTVLDWRIKLALYQDFCRQRGVCWDSLPRWTIILNKLASSFPNAKGESKSLRERIARSPERLAIERRRHNKLLAQQALKWEDVPQVLEVRSQLFELETRFLQIGGIFQSLSGSGVLSHRVLRDSAINSAVLNPPSGGRAQLRGEFIRERAKGDGSSAGWTKLVDGRSHRVGLIDDPFATSIRWRPLTEQTRNEGFAEDVRSAALSAYLDGRYEEAERFLQHLVVLGFQLPSTHCHLARIAIMRDDFSEAVAHTEQAWQLREQAERYIVPRILWLKIALQIVCNSDTGWADLMRPFTEALDAAVPVEWSMAPVLDHLQAMLSPELHRLLCAMSATISDSSARPALEALPLWNSFFEPAGV